MTPARPRRRTVSAVAMALVMTSTGSLPALAALAPAAPAGQSRSFQAGSLESSPWLLADKHKDDKREDEKKKRKKNNNKKNSGAKTKTSNHGNSRNNKSGRNKKNNRRDKNNRNNNNQLSNKQRQRIYEQGREDGFRKGKDKGLNRGYRQGFDDGKDRGKRKGYTKASRRAEQRKQWKSWNKDQWKRYNRSRRNVWVNPGRNNRGYSSYPSWARNSNWGNNNSNSLPWSWWGGQALGWGINALTTALIVNSAINRSIEQRQPTVQVPRSNYNLYYGSVEPIDNTAVNFVVDNGGYTYQLQADCSDGLLDGEVPTTLAEAELINTACQVTYGSL